MKDNKEFDEILKIVKHQMKYEGKSSIRKAIKEELWEIYKEKNVLDEGSSEWLELNKKIEKLDALEAYVNSKVKLKNDYS